MPRRYLAFDIETAKDVPGEDFDWRSHRPLGIACAATLTGDDRALRLWHGKSAGGTPAAKMRREDVCELMDYLAASIKAGYTVVSWNGLGFDFDVLAEECGDPQRCEAIALDHVDMMFHAHCCLGYPIGLDRTARAMGLPGKPQGMSGAKAPAMWAAGKYDEVLKYVTQDVETALAIAHAVDKRRRLDWITRNGSIKNLPLANGWLTVRAAYQLPLPDTSWMDSPIDRREFMGWLTSV
jgi:hypothetical protein